jgi:hypothetical protein
MKVIKVPKVSARAFNKNRPASDLLKKQVAQLQHVVETVTGGPGPVPARKVRTEGQAAAYIAQATRALHPEATRPAAQAAPTPTPARPARPSRPRPARSARKGRTR